jgi:hypothetical protein
MNPALIRAAGTGRSRSTTSTLRGLSASATGARASSTSTTAAPCGVCGGELEQTVSSTRADTSGAAARRENLTSKMEKGMSEGSGKAILDRGVRHLGIAWRRKRRVSQNVLNFTQPRPAVFASYNASSARFINPDVWLGRAE